ncbi:hypothetical protein HOLDEFILI_04149 [Holdemania filiformis DSM 12042]|uniref:Uncharacterized protein n=1 Tax=Holdemania filiformis DSM 12042 TaxID=545696 RepID=B9YE75_9FIRM|nr:hypothetical protein HOLDEFILI_04149 [Holdemania filiformis DSM 12042]
MIPMKTFPCFHGRKGCAFPGAVFFCVKNRSVFVGKNERYAIY